MGVASVAIAGLIFSGGTVEASGTTDAVASSQGDATADEALSTEDSTSTAVRSVPISPSGTADAIGNVQTPNGASLLDLTEEEKETVNTAHQTAISTPAEPVADPTSKTQEGNPTVIYGFEGVAETIKTDREIASQDKKLHDKIASQSDNGPSDGMVNIDPAPTEDAMANDLPEDESAVKNKENTNSTGNPARDPRTLANKSVLDDGFVYFNMTVSDTLSPENLAKSTIDIRLRNHTDKNMETSDRYRVTLDFDERLASHITKIEHMDGNHARFAYQRLKDSATGKNTNTWEACAYDEAADQAGVFSGKTRSPQEAIARITLDKSIGNVLAPYQGTSAI